MNLSQAERIKEIVLRDTISLPNSVVSILKSEVKQLLNSYFYLSEQEIKINITIEKNKFVVNINSLVDGVKNISSM